MNQSAVLTKEWKLYPADRESLRKYTSYFDKNDSLEIDSLNSVYTELIKHEALSDKVRYISDTKWVLEKDFVLDPSLLKMRSVIKMDSCLSLEINEKNVPSKEITEYIKEGKNHIKIITSSSFSGPVELLFSTECAIENATLRPVKLDEHTWCVNFHLTLSSFKNQDIRIVYSLLGETSDKVYSIKEGEVSLTIPLTIPKEKIELWNISGDGKQKIYTASIKVGEIEFTRRTAFRTTEIRNGSLYVNGKEIFIMGAIWPITIYPDKRRYEKLLQNAKSQNINALYIPSGHENHEFYFMTDVMGIIVLHNEENPSFLFHPSFMTGESNIDIYEARVHSETGLDKCLDAISLERWVLKSRSDNMKHGVLYDNILSTMTIDGELRPSHYAARRFFADLVPIMYKDGDKIRVFISNDGDKDEECEVKLRFMTYEGVKKNEYFYNVKAPSHTALEVANVNLRNKDTKKEFATVRVESAKIHRELTLLLDDIATLPFIRPAITYTIRVINDNTVSIRLKTDKPAFAVHLLLDGFDGSFSDNFFELFADSEKSVVFSSSSRITEKDVMDNLKIYDISIAKDIKYNN